MRRRPEDGICRSAQMSLAPEHSSEVLTAWIVLKDCHVLSCFSDMF